MRANEYVRVHFWHTNTIDNAFSLLKRGITGIYHQVSQQHLRRCLGEFGFRINHKGISDAERTTEVLKGIGEKRLTYRRIDQAVHAWAESKALSTLARQAEEEIGMADVGSIAAAYTGLKTAYDLTTSFLKLKLSAETQSKVIELQGVIVAAQQDAFVAQTAQTALLKRVDELEQQIAEFEAWEAEKQRYQLTDFGGGTFAYVLKADMTYGEPIHKVCPTCFQKGHKSILQSLGPNAFRQEMCVCTTCETKLSLGKRSDPYADDHEGGGSSWIDARR